MTPIFDAILPADYCESAILAHEIINRAIDRLTWMTLRPEIIVDLGCGPGSATIALKNFYPESRLVSIDVSLSMLQASKNSDGICALAESLPLKNASVDFIFANLLLPWCAHPLLVLQECQRVLRPQGLMILTCFGMDTLTAIPDIIPIREDMHNIGDALLVAGLADPVLDVEYITLTYASKEKALCEAKNMGIITDASLPLFPNEQGLFQLPFEIIYAHAWGKQKQVAVDKNSVVRVPLSQIIKS